MYQVEIACVACDVIERHLNRAGTGDADQIRPKPEDRDG
jgi:hypothetical protein